MKENDVFEIVDYYNKPFGGNKVLSVRLKKTGEIINVGDKVWHKRYLKYIVVDHFDASLTGTMYFNEWYEGYFRNKGGELFKLEEVCLHEPTSVDKLLEFKNIL